MLKALKLIGRGTKIVGMAIGGGGWAAGMLDPAMAAVIAGAALLLGDMVVFGGDLMDDGKLNQSFKID